jgi:cation:H+ antiporter
MFFAYYCAYTASFVIAETIPEFHRTYAIVMLGFVVPLTVVTLLTGVIRSIRQGRSRKPLSEELSTVT